MSKDRQGFSFPWSRKDIPFLFRGGPRFDAKEQVTKYHLPQVEWDGLSSEQQRGLEHLRDTAEPIDDFFQRQQHFGFWPQGTTEEEINSASDYVRSPYTRKFRDDNGALNARPYSQDPDFREPSLEIAAKLEDAADELEKSDEKTSFYLRVQTRAWRTGNPEDFKEANRLYILSAPTAPVTAVVTLADADSDEFGMAFSAEALGGKQNNKRAPMIREVIGMVGRWWSFKTGKLFPPNFARAEDTRFIAGQAVKMDWSAISHPGEKETREETGSVVVLFLPRFDEKLPQVKASLFAIIPPQNRRLIDIPENQKTKEDRAREDEAIIEMLIKTFVAHEVGHSLGIPEDMKLRFKKPGLALKELYCDLVSIVSLGQSALDPDPKVDRRKKNLLLATYFANGGTEDKGSKYYVAVWTIAKYCIYRRSMSIKRGGILDWKDPSNVIAHAESLLNLVTNVLEEREEPIARAGNFFDRYYRDIYAQLKKPRPDSIKVIPVKKPSDIVSLDPNLSTVIEPDSLATTVS